jgi:hypothetical protein
MPTVNQKFERFVDDLFDSHQKAADVKDQIVKYVQVLETNYSEVVRTLRDEINSYKQRLVRHQTSETEPLAEKQDLLKVFTACVDTVRAELMKTRMKKSLENRKLHKLRVTEEEETRSLE